MVFESAEVALGGSNSVPGPSAGSHRAWMLSSACSAPGTSASARPAFRLRITTADLLCATTFGTGARCDLTTIFGLFFFFGGAGFGRLSGWVMKMGKYLRLFDRSWLWRNFRLFRGRRIGRVARLRLFSPAVRQPLLLELIFPKPGEELLLFADPLFDSLFFEKRADFFFGAEEKIKIVYA